MNYPQAVEEYLTKWLPEIKKTFNDSDFGTYDDDVIQLAINGVIGPLSFNRFISSGDVEISVKDEKEINILLNKICSNTIIYSLHKKGIIDMIEDEKGDQVIFLTAHGKEIAEYILQFL